MEEAEEKAIKKRVVQLANQSERMSWNRKRKNIDKAMKKMEPISAQILKLNATIAPIADDIAKIRIEMVNTCIHPDDMLLVHEATDGEPAHVECKFCLRKLSANG